MMGAKSGIGSKLEGGVVDILQGRESTKHFKLQLDGEYTAPIDIFALRSLNNLFDVLLPWVIQALLFHLSQTTTFVDPPVWPWYLCCEYHIILTVFPLLTLRICGT